MFFHPWRLSSILMMGVILACQVPVRTMVTVDADHAFIQYSGRFENTDPKKPRFDWPGTAIQARFTGTSLSVKISGGDNDFNVIIDGEMKSHLALEKGKTVYQLAADLTDSEHSLLLTKRTEGFNGIVTFEGLILADGKSLIAPTSTAHQKVQFYGDSYTVGYGTEATVLNCPDRRPFDNNYMAYGPLSARALNLEYSVQAVSGYGMVHNYGDVNPTSPEPLPAVFDRTLFNQASPKWNFAAWIPDMVVIALGTNDFSTATKPSRTQYTAAYKAFITKIRGYHPGVQILCLTFAGDQFQGPYVADMVLEYNSQGDNKIHAFAMPELAQSDLGCDYHPNLSGQKKYSVALIPIIRQYLPVATGLKGQSKPSDPDREMSCSGISQHSDLRMYRSAPKTAWSDVQGRTLGQ